MAAQQAQRQYEVAEAVLKAIAAAEQVRRLAEEDIRISAEKANKHVNCKWLVGTWVEIDYHNSEDRKNPHFYCATDSRISFNANGRYDWFDEKGIFSLSKDDLKTFQKTEAWIRRTDAKPHELDAKIVKVEKSGKQLMIDDSRFALC